LRAGAGLGLEGGEGWEPGGRPEDWGWVGGLDGADGGWELGLGRRITPWPRKPCPAAVRDSASTTGQRQHLRAV
jgi:hypothetical protein